MIIQMWKEEVLSMIYDIDLKALVLHMCDA